MGTNYKYIKKLTIPDTATFINDEAFCGLTNLTDITIPQSVCYIGAGAFRNCRQLSNVHLPDILPVIRAETFNGCHHLQKVDFPSTLMSIEEKAFEYCYRLKTANFPASLNIGKCDPGLLFSLQDFFDIRHRFVGSALRSAGYVKKHRGININHGNIRISEYSRKLPVCGYTYRNADPVFLFRSGLRRRFRILECVPYRIFRTEQGVSL